MTYECIGKRSEKPYIIRDTQTGIYSLEELLFYVRENVFMLNPDDFGAGLAKFMRSKLMLPELAERYEALLKSHAGLSDRICMLFSETHFTSEGEIETLRKALSMSEHMSNNDSHRVRGDFFFKSGRIAEAVIEYNAALKLINREENPGDAAKLLTGMGNAAARSFRFENALKYYEEASSLEPNEPELLSKLIAAARLEKNDAEFYKYMEERNIPESIYSGVLGRISEAEKRSGRRNDAKALKEAKKARADGDFAEYMRLRRGILNDWKNRYRNTGV